MQNVCIKCSVHMRIPGTHIARDSLFIVSRYTISTDLLNGISGCHTSIFKVSPFLEFLLDVIFWLNTIVDITVKGSSPGTPIHLIKFSLYWISINQIHENEGRRNSYISYKLKWTDILINGKLLALFVWSRFTDSLCV